MEIERKFIVHIEDLPIKLEDLPAIRVVQGYLNPEDEYIIRVREATPVSDTNFPVYVSSMTSYKMEVKSRGLLEREEYKANISKETFDEMYLNCKRCISKTRYVYIQGSYAYEIDVYDDLEELTLEVEFASREESDNFIVPDWFGTDITYDENYKNVNLAS